MKLMYFNDFRLGVVKGDNVVDVTAAVQNIPHTGPGNLINGVIERWADVRGRIDSAANSGKGLPVTQVKIRPPLPKPINVDCMAVNYMEDGTRKQAAEINAFHKSPGCIIAHGETMIMPDIPLSILEGEAELAVVIGKRAKNVTQARAMEHVFGLMAPRAMPPSSAIRFIRLNHVTPSRRLGRIWSPPTKSRIRTSCKCG